MTDFIPFFADKKSKFFIHTKDDFNYTEEVWRFKQIALDQGFVYGFNYFNWLDNEGGNKYTKNPALLDTADILTIQKLLTSIMRIDRFNMSAKGEIGLLKFMIENGVILKILQRLEQIRLEMIKSNKKQS